MQNLAYNVQRRLVYSDVDSVDRVEDGWYTQDDGHSSPRACGQHRSIMKRNMKI